MSLVAKPISWIDDNVVGEVYEWIVRGPVLKVAWLCRRFDSEAIDGTVHAVGSGTLGLSEVLRVLQTGRANHYAVVLALGALVLVVAGFALV